MKVLVVQRIFADYRKPIFDELVKKVDLKLLHAKNKSGIKQTNSEYSKEVFAFSYGKKSTNVYLSILKKVMNFKPHIVVHEFTPSIISLHLAFFLRKIFNYKFIIWGHGYNHNKGFKPGKDISSKIRLFYLKNSDAVIVYSKSAKEILSQYVNPDKLFVAANTLNTPLLLKIKSKLDEEGKESIKEKLCFEKSYNLTFIGRLIKEKKPEILLDILEKLNQEIRKNTGIHFVGAGEMQEVLKEEVKAKGLQSHVFFHGPLYDNQLIGKILYASDLMVMPGYVGLSVNHAFCFDCPVATFKQGPKGPFHSPEIEYIIHNKTGLLANSFDVDDLTNKIHRYLIQKELQSEMKKNVNYTINNICSLDNMIEGFMNSFKWVKNE